MTKNIIKHKYSKKHHTFDLLNASYQNNSNASKIGKKHGYRMDYNLSNDDQKVFYKPQKSPIIVYPGTYRKKDINTDLKLAIGKGKNTHRFQNALKNANAIENKYGKNAKVMGHSLGGSIAEYVGSQNSNRKVITYNKGIGINQIGKKINPNQTDIRHKKDLISLLNLTQHGGKKIEINNNQNLISAHKLKSLIN